MSTSWSLRTDYGFALGFDQLIAPPTENRERRLEERERRLELKLPSVEHKWFAFLW